MSATGPASKKGGTAGFASSLRPHESDEEGPHDHPARVQRRRAASRPAGAGARRARVLARQRHLQQVAGADRRRPPLDVLRGPAHRQRHAGHPPHRGARFQGRVPAFQDDAGLPRRPEGRVGLPRTARRARRREGARLLRQGRHRGLRRRGVQRALPRVGHPPRRRLDRSHRAHGLLGEHGRGLLDHEPRVRAVGVVEPQADPRRRPAGRGLPRRPLLPPLRHDAVRPRARPGLRGRHRPVGLRPLPADQRPARGQGRPARLDDHALDARLQHRRRRAPRRHLRGRLEGRRHARHRRAARREGARRGLEAGPVLLRQGDGGLALPASVRAGRVPRRRRRHALRRQRRVRHGRGRHRPRAPGARLR